MPDEQASRRAYYLRNRERVVAKSRAYREMNRDKISIRRRELYRGRSLTLKKQSNRLQYAKFRLKMQNPMARQQILEKRKICYDKRMLDPFFRLGRTLQSRLRNAVNRLCKSAKTIQLVGCTIEFLRAHLEKQFVPGMTWENYGRVWHVDHILPCDAFHLQHSEEQEICFNWSNLQPLFAKDNICKGDKIL